MRVELIVSYDGTNYCGWQIQKNGITVEEILNRELRRLLKEDVYVIGASRTDSGVHCRGNIAVFDTQTRIPAEKICYALNERLPDDIVVQQSREVLPDFHPRKCNSRKTYEYRILNRRFRDPLNRLYAYFVYVPLDVEAMRAAAAYLEGEHDFASFCSSGSQASSTVRTLYEVTLEKEGDLITLRLTGNGFLYNMVRIIAGTLIKVGMHVYRPEHVQEILEARDRRAAGPKAPGVGLTLMKIEIDEKEPHYPFAASGERRPCSPDASVDGMKPCISDAAFDGMKPCIPDAAIDGMKPCISDAAVDGMRPCISDAAVDERKPRGSWSMVDEEE